MLFSTPVFLFLFLPVSLVLYFAVPQRLKNLSLLAASLCFFLWGEPYFTLLVLFSAVFDWRLTRAVAAAQSVRLKKLLAGVAVSSNILMLVYYKYTNFIFDNLNDLFTLLNFNTVVLEQILLPIGVSFIVFEKITYIVDVYKGVGQASPSLLNYLVYVFLFPKLLAGPIVKYHEIAGQLSEHTTRREDVYYGTVRFAVGLGKKVFIADTMAEYADMVFGGSAGALGMGQAWLGAVCFAVQIYYDFAGYSDMAIGMARILGFKLRENFNSPYTADNFTEFWRRWHISLSTWIREYVYIPLGGNRVGRARLYGNLITAFLLSGIWHGANWTFVVWGAYHGLFLIADRVFWRDLQQKLPRAVNWLITLLLLIVGWVIFRSPDIGYAAEYLLAMIGLGESGTRFIYAANHIYVFLGVGAVMAVLPLITAKASWDNVMNKRYDKYVIGFVLLIMFLGAAKASTTTFNPFLYFRF